MSEKVREFWFIKNNLGTAICFAEIPPSKSYKKYIDKQAYDRLAEINKVLVEALIKMFPSHSKECNSSRCVDYCLRDIKNRALAKAKEMGK